MSQVLLDRIYRIYLIIALSAFPDERLKPQSASGGGKYSAPLRALRDTCFYLLVFFTLSASACPVKCLPREMRSIFLWGVAYFAGAPSVRDCFCFLSFGFLCPITYRIAPA